MLATVPPRYLGGYRILDALVLPRGSGDQFFCDFPSRLRHLWFAKDFHVDQRAVDEQGELIREGGGFLRSGRRSQVADIMVENAFVFGGQFMHGVARIAIFTGCAAEGAAV